MTHEGVAAWVSALSARGLSAATVRQAHRVLSLMFGLAVRDGRLARNPANGVPLPRAVKGDQIYHLRNFRRKVFDRPPAKSD